MKRALLFMVEVQKVPQVFGSTVSDGDHVMDPSHSFCVQVQLCSVAYHKALVQNGPNILDGSLALQSIP